MVVQTIEGYILTPRILGGRLSLHPMAFLGLLIGGKLLGLLGIILAVPTFITPETRSQPKLQDLVLEERLADAAETVLAEQIGSERGRGTSRGQKG